MLYNLSSYFNFISGCNYVKEGMRQKKAIDSQLIAVKEAVDAAKSAAPKKSTESRVFTPKSKPAK